MREIGVTLHPSLKLTAPQQTKVWVSSVELASERFDGGVFQSTPLDIVITSHRNTYGERDDIRVTSAEQWYKVLRLEGAYMLHSGTAKGA